MMLELACVGAIALLGLLFLATMAADNRKLRAENKRLRETIQEMCETGKAGLAGKR